MYAYKSLVAQFPQRIKSIHMVGIFLFFSTQYTDLIKKFKTLILSSEFDSLEFIALLLDFCPLCHLLCSLVFLHV